MSGEVDEVLLPAGRGSPEDERDSVGLAVDGADHLVGEGLPAPAGVRRGGVGSHGEHRVEQQHPLPGPGLEAAVAGVGNAEIALEFPVDVRQRGRHAHTLRDAEAQAVGLTRPVVRILAEDEHLGLGERGEVQRRKDLFRRGKHGGVGALVPQEFLEFGPVGLVELGPEKRIPVCHQRHVTFSGCSATMSIKVAQSHRLNTTGGLGRRSNRQASRTLRRIDHGTHQHQPSLPHQRRALHAHNALGDSRARSLSPAQASPRSGLVGMRRRSPTIEEPRVPSPGALPHFWPGRAQARSGRSEQAITTSSRRPVGPSSNGSIAAR